MNGEDYAIECLRNGIGDMADAAGKLERARQWYSTALTHVQDGPVKAELTARVRRCNMALNALQAPGGTL